jgi:uncharacterized protein
VIAIEEINLMNQASEAFKPRECDRLLLFSIEKSLEDRADFLDATRYAWPVNRWRAENIDLILGCVRGVVEGVFVAEEWLEASPGKQTETNFGDLLKKYPRFKPTHSTKPQRYGFRGREADEASRRHYLGKLVPDSLRIGQNGFRYSD